jgi:hypothetical protein
LDLWAHSAHFTIQYSTLYYCLPSRPSLFSPGPRTSCRPNYSLKTELLNSTLSRALLALLCSRNPFLSSLFSECLLSSVSEIYDIWTDCREDTAFGIVGCLAITRKRLPSGLGLARYQATSTPQRARHNILVTVKT